MHIKALKMVIGDTDGHMASTSVHGETSHTRALSATLSRVEWPSSSGIDITRQTDSLTCTG